MGGKRQRLGVRAISDSSIQIDFTYYHCQRCRERLKLAPTPANLKRAELHRAAILDAIERGTFDYATTFPDSPRRFAFAEYRGAGYPLEDYLEQWLTRQKQHLKASTWDDYRKIVFNTLIPRTVRLAEAPSHGMPINIYDSKSTGAESYRLLAAEVISRGEEL